MFQGSARVDSERVFNNAALILFHRPNLSSLLFNGHAFVDNTDATLLSNGNRSDFPNRAASLLADPDYRIRMDATDRLVNGLADKQSFS